MTSRPDMIADFPADGNIGGGKSARIKSPALRAEKPVNLGGSGGGQILSLRIGVQIIRGAGDINRPRRGKGNQEILVERQIFFMIPVTLKRRAEPVGPPEQQEVDGLSENTPGKRGAAASRFIGNDHCKARIDGTCPESRLPETGMSVDNHPF